MALAFLMQVSLSSLCFITSDFWHKAHTREGEKWKKDNSIKYPGAVRLKTTKLMCKTPTQKNLPKVLYLQMLMSWACTRAPWRTLKFPWHFVEPYCLVFASIHIQEVQDAGCKAALSALTVGPSSERLHTTSLQRVSHRSGARSTRHLLEKASANLHWLKRQLLLVRPNLSLHEP